jgi:hypothetical protein
MLRKCVFNVTEMCILGKKYGVDTILHFCLTIGYRYPNNKDLHTFASSKRTS